MSASPGHAPGGGLVLVLHGEVSPDAPPDEQDTLVQADLVRAALTRLGYVPGRLMATLDLATLRRELLERAPLAVFNLVESLGGSGQLVHVVLALLDEMRIPYTGVPTFGMLQTSQKLFAKRMLNLHGIPTPAAVTRGKAAGIQAAPQSRWILKSVWEHASLGMDDDAVMLLGDYGFAAIEAALDAKIRRHGGEWFAEAFVDGREFNLSLLETPQGPVVLPVAEIVFEDFPPDKPRIVGYRAKWEPGSFEYRKTPRRFLGTREPELVKILRDLALRCWDAFSLAGYARVDFRVDSSGKPWVLEINANPGIASDAGFPAAAAQAGISFDALINTILSAALRRAAP